MYATDGDDTLGGSDIDLCLFKILKDRIQEVTDVDINKLSSSSATTTAADTSSISDAGAGSGEGEIRSADMCTAAAVHTMAEEIKKALTYEEEVPFKCTMPQVHF